MPEPVRKETLYEQSDASATLILGLAAGVVAFVMIAAAVLSISYHPILRPSSRGPHPLPPKPRLLINEPAALESFETGVGHRLDTYGWIDRQRGIVRIPIKDAMKRAAAQGFPHWPGNPQ